MGRLIVREGETTRIFELADDQVGLGRATDNDIVLEDTKSSRNHAVLRRTPTGFELIDLESRNGTRVNGDPVKQRLLQEGDVIQIGQATITYTLQDTDSNTAESKEPDTDNGAEEEIVEGLELPPHARRFGRGRAGLRKTRTPIILKSPAAPKPVEPPRPQPPVVVPDPSRNAETHVAATPDELDALETPVELSTPAPMVAAPRPATPEPEPASPPLPQRSENMRKFHLLDQGRVRTFVRNPVDKPAPLPLEGLFADAGELIPWDEVFKTEGRSGPEADRAGAAMLMELKDPDSQKASILLVDSAGVLTVVEDAAADEAKAHRSLIGKGINLAATLATDWTAETLRREFEAYARKTGREPGGILQAAFGKPPSPEFWKGVERGLQSGAIRVVFLVREATVAIQKVIDFLFGSTNMTAYALQLETFQELKAERPRNAFTVKLYGPSKNARQSRTTKAPEETRSALDVVSM